MVMMIALRLKSKNVCYHLVQNLLSSSLLSKYLTTQIYRTIILPVVLYGCETWSLTLREERRLRVFENRVLRRMLGPSWVIAPQKKNVRHCYVWLYVQSLLLEGKHCTLRYNARALLHLLERQRVVLSRGLAVANKVATLLQ
jgi:hypothetical protein